MAYFSSSPEAHVPWWLLIWFRQSGLVLLSSAVLTFLTGLLLFVIENVVSAPNSHWLVRTHDEIERQSCDLDSGVLHDILTYGTIQYYNLVLV